MNALLDSVLQTLRARRANIEARYRVRLLGVFGSTAREQGRPDSDLDLLADRVGAVTLLELAHLEDELSDLFGRPVDVLLRDGLPDHWRRIIERDLVSAS